MSRKGRTEGMLPFSDQDDSPDPPLRVMSLHALLYCARLFYLEEVEEIRVADDRVFAGRELHQSLEDEEAEGVQTYEVSSEKLGLFGKLDSLKRRDGVLVPIEHKRGRCRRAEDGTPQPWPSDRIQAGAYALLLEEHLGKTIAEARVRYHAEKVTVRIPVDETLRADVLAAIRRARELRQSTERPPIADNENLCRHCSLAPVCLPEEVRQDHEPEYQ